MPFIKQNDPWSCAPVALMNVMKMLGKKVYGKDLAKYRKKLKWTSRGGIWADEMDRALKKLGVSYFKRTRNITMGSIDHRLDQGYFGLFLFAWDDEDAHFILITDKSWITSSYWDNYERVKGYKTINYSWGCDPDCMTRSELRSHLRTKWGCGYTPIPSVWWIKKL